MAGNAGRVWHSVRIRMRTGEGWHVPFGVSDDPLTNRLPATEVLVFNPKSHHVITSFTYFKHGVGRGQVGGSTSSNPGPSKIIFPSRRRCHDKDMHHTF